MSAQATADLILGVTILMPLTVCLVVVAVTWTLEDLAAWSEERAKRGRQWRQRRRTGLWQSSGEQEDGLGSPLRGWVESLHGTKPSWWFMVLEWTVLIATVLFVIALTTGP